MEDSLFRQSSPTAPVLLFYRNRPSVLFGRNQNPWAECDVYECLKEGIVLLRRLSGGGTVYQDTGNLNCCLILPQKQFNLNQWLELLLRALHRAGVHDAAVTDETNITIGGRKLCGSAFARNRTAVLLHSCLLVHSNLSALRGLLRLPNGLSVQHSYIPSRPVPVTSLHQEGSSLCCADMIRILTDVFAEEFGTPSPLPLPEDDSWRTTSQTFIDTDWTFRRCADFSMTWKLDNVTSLHLDIRNGIIQTASLRHGTKRDSLDTLIGMPLETLPAQSPFSFHLSRFFTSPPIKGKSFV